MKQITVLARSQGNMIADVTDILAGAGVNIDSITGEHYGAQAVVNITVDNEQTALYALQKRLDWQIIHEDALLVQVKDEIGTLAKLARRLADKNVAIRSIRFVERYDGHALVAIATEHPEEAREAVKDIAVG